LQEDRRTENKSLSGMIISPHIEGMRRAKRSQQAGLTSWCPSSISI